MLTLKTHMLRGAVNWSRYAWKPNKKKTAHRHWRGTVIWTCNRNKYLSLQIITVSKCRHVWPTKHVYTACTMCKGRQERLEGGRVETDRSTNLSCLLHPQKVGRQLTRRKKQRGFIYKSSEDLTEFIASPHKLLLHLIFDLISFSNKIWCSSWTKRECF